MSQVRAWLLAGIGLTFVLTIVLGYFGRAWSEEMIFFLDDGHCSPGQGIGRHCFGDFAYPYFSVLNKDTFIEGNLVASISPFVLLIFFLLTNLSFHIALIVYLLLSLASVTVPFICIKSSVKVSEKISWLFLIGVLSLGSLSGLDRGNTVVFVVPVIFFLLQAVQRENWRRVSILLVALVTIKTWGIFFLIVLIINKKRLLFLYTLLGVLVLNFVAFLILHLNGFSESVTVMVRRFIDSTLDKDYADFVSAYSISLAGFAKRIVCAYSEQTACDMTQISTGWIGSSGAKGALLIALLGTVIHLWRSSLTPEYIKFTSLVGLSIMAVPDAAIYNTVSVVSLFPILIHYTNYPSASNRPRSAWEKIAAIPIVASLTPFGLAFRENWIGGIVVNGQYWWRSQYLSIPTAWIIFYILAGVYSWRQRSNFAQ